MRRKTKQMGIALVATIMLVVVFQVKSSKALAEQNQEIAVGCRYTGSIFDSCTAVEGATIYKCTNTFLAISCEFDRSDPIEN